MPLIDDDWGNSLDDADGGDWADFLSGPDYEYTPPQDVSYAEEQEREREQAELDWEYEQAEMQAEYYDQYEPDYDYQTVWKIANRRQAQILQWLVCYGYFNIKGTRYYIHRGNTLVFNDGNRLDVIDFLLAEGISSNFRCFEYAVSHVGSGTKSESFWMTVIPSRLVSGIDTFKDIKPSEVERFDFLVDIKCIDKKPLPERPSDRQIDIVNWLSNSKHIKPFRNGKGFYIAKGIKIKLKNGNIIDIIDWLIEEGLTKHRSIGEYNIKHDPPGDFQEKINFFKINIQ